MWLERKMFSLRKAGQLFLASERNIDVKLFSAPKYVKEIKKLTRVINFSRSNIKSLQGIPKLNKLIELNIDNTEISNFANIKSFPHLRKISFKNCPNLPLDSAQLSLVIALPELTSINDKQISEKVRNKAKDYPEYVPNLIDAGWLAVHPCPPQHEMRELCKQYNVEFIEDFEPESVDDESNDNDYNANNDDFSFEDCVSYLIQKHEDMQKKSMAMFGITDGSKSGSSQQSPSSAKSPSFTIYDI